MSTFVGFNIFHPSFNHFTDIQSWLFSFLMLYFVGSAVPKYFAHLTARNVTLLWQPEYYPLYGFLFAEFKLIKELHKKWLSQALYTRFIISGFLTGALQSYPFFLCIALMVNSSLWIRKLVKEQPYIDKNMLWWNIYFES